MEKPHTVILYHGKCPDGFGGAYAAWKKFGDNAEYIPIRHGKPVPNELEGRDIYMIDFAYDEIEKMHSISDMAKRFVVLEHHLGAKKIVEQIHEHIFDEKHSGATIAWKYFHPHTPIPLFLTHIEDGDLYHYAFKETRDIYSYIDVHTYNFNDWDTLVQIFKNQVSKEQFLKTARIYSEYFLLMGDYAVAGAKLVKFEGYECYFTNTHPSMTMKSYVANKLYTKKPPIALVVSAHPNGFGVSIRGDKSVDVAKIAEKFGGNGHPGSAGFFIKNGDDMPWTEIES